MLNMRNSNGFKRIESENEVQTFLSRLKYALETGSSFISFIGERQIDRKRDEKFTNKFTLAKLFPDADVPSVLKTELMKITIDDYIETVKDKKRPKRSDMRVFGKKYSGEYVYIKIRVELVNTVDTSGKNYIFVMSFHFAEFDISEKDFPYTKD